MSSSRRIDVYNGYIKIPVRNVKVKEGTELDIENTLYSAMMELGDDIEFVGEIHKELVNEY